MHKLISLKYFCITLFFSVAVCSCHSSKESFIADDIYAKRTKRPKTEQIKTDTSSETKGNYSRPNVKAGKREKDVIDAACEWLGVPYRYGGNSRSGVDCSGLVCMAFERGAGVTLPRTSIEQANYCKKISRAKAKPGDLVFFVSKKGGKRINHVAIYLGENRVVHSTTSCGVIISSLEDEYWRTHFHSCGRVFL